MDAAIIVCVIALSLLIVAILVLLGILFYNQMLVTNEVNKRLLLLTQESIEKERSTQGALNDALVELERQANEGANPQPQAKAEDDESDVEPFDPHSYMEDHGVV